MASERSSIQSASIYAIRHCAILLALICMCSTPYLAHAVLIGTSRGQPYLYDIDASTGLASIRVYTGHTQITGFAAVPVGPQRGQYYATSLAGQLFTLDIDTGNLILLGTAANKSVTFDSSGNMYLLTDTSTGPGALLTHDLATHVTTAIGNIPFLSSTMAGAIAFDGADNLFAVAVQQSNIDYLLRIDPATAAVLSSVPLSVSIGNIVGMAFDPAINTMFLTDGGYQGANNLYTVNLSNGQLTLIGNTGLWNGIEGLAVVVAPPIPEPATIGLIGLAVVGLLNAVTLRRRSK